MKDLIGAAVGSIISGIGLAIGAYIGGKIVDAIDVKLPPKKRKIGFA